MSQGVKENLPTITLLVCLCVFTLLAITAGEKLERHRLEMNIYRNVLEMKGYTEVLIRSTLDKCFTFTAGISRGGVKYLEKGTICQGVVTLEK